MFVASDLLSRGHRFDSHLFCRQVTTLVSGEVVNAHMPLSAV